MNPSQTIDLEFSPHGRPITLAMRAVSKIEQRLAPHSYRLEPLVRVNGRLVNALDTDVDDATAYAWRIHLAPLEHRTWSALYHDVLDPLRTEGFKVRTRQLAAA